MSSQASQSSSAWFVGGLPFMPKSKTVGTSGGPLLTQESADRWVVVAGVYEGDGAETHLLPAPVLTGLAVAPADDAQRRELDMRTGALHERTVVAGRAVEMTRFVSLARPASSFSIPKKRICTRMFTARDS